MTKIDRRLDAVDKRFDTIESRFASTTVRLENKIEEEVSGLAAMITKGFADIEKRLDVKTAWKPSRKTFARGSLTLAWCLPWWGR